MKLKIQILVMLTTFIIAILLAAGCGSSGSENTGVNATSSGGAPTEVVGGTN